MTLVEKNRETILVALVISLIVFVLGWGITLIIVGAIGLGIPLLIGWITFMVTAIVMKCRYSSENEPLL